MLTRGSVTNVLIKRYICEKEIQLFLDQEFCSKETQCLNKEILLGLGREVLLCQQEAL